MDRIVEQFMEITRRSIGLPEKNVDFSDADWNMLFELGYMNKQLLLVSNVICAPKSGWIIPEKTVKGWTQLSYREFALSAARLNSARKILNALYEAGVIAVVLKGYAIAALYPSPMIRTSNDLDIKVNSEDQKRIEELMQKNGFSRDEELSKKNVHIYTDKALAIEVHYTLWEDYKGKSTEILQKEFLDNPEQLIEVNALGCRMRTLGVTEHLIVQMFHIAKHFMVEGIQCRYFLDITFYINHYAEEIDFQRFWKVMDELGYADFTGLYFTECIKWFSMNEKALNGRSVETSFDENAFLHDIIFVGKRDLNDNVSFNLLGILAPYVNGGKVTASTKAGRMVHAIFPSVSEIGENYSYCWKYRFLLPVAWVHRAMHAAILKMFHRSEVYGAQEKLAAAEYRIQMMKNAGLIKNM